MNCVSYRLNEQSFSPGQLFVALSLKSTNIALPFALKRNSDEGYHSFSAFIEFSLKMVCSFFDCRVIRDQGYCFLHYQFGLSGDQKLLILLLK